MKQKFAILAIATTAAVSSGAVWAQQIQEFGRDSIHAAPGRSSSNVTTRSDVDRFGRDSVYATPSPTSSAPVLAGGLNRYGRDSVYAAPFQDGSVQQTGPAIGTTGIKGNGG